MPLYEYRCPIHGAFLTESRADNHPCPHDGDCMELSQRVWGVNVKPGFREGYNPTLNQYISSPSQLRTALSMASDRASAPTSITDDNGEVHHINRAPANFKPVDMRDKEALGVTNEGLDSTYDALRREGKDDQAKRLKALMDE